MKPLFAIQFLVFSFLCSFQGRSQNTSTPLVVVEQIQAFSYLNPTATYWQIPANINPILETLDTSLFVTLKLQRDKNYTTNTKTLTKLTQTGKIKIDWERSKTIPYHAYIEIYEMDPGFAYQNDLVKLSKEKKDSIHSVWFIACSIFNLKQERVFQKTIMLGFTPIESLGIGYTIRSSASMPNLLFNAITKAMNYLDTEGEEINFIDVKIPAAYATDNYWMPFVHNMPRVLFDTSKKFISFIDNAGLPVFNENNPKLAIQFLSEARHRIFQDKDSIGYFIVNDFVKEENKFYYPDIVYNGYDSTQTVNLGTSFAKQPITHSRVISGSAMNHDFAVQLNYENNITTLLIDKKIVMAISGNKKPIQMVEKRVSLPALENLLLLIAYAEIFQQPG